MKSALVSIVALAGAGLASVSATEADALTLRNADQKPYSVTVTENGDPKKVEIKPEQSLTNICPKGCVVALENGEQYEFEGTETVSIEDGAIFLDEGEDEEDSTEPPPADE